jgi:diguanylate cyclase (GGDEF)-like protein/PAS domain S-box-containing protein
MSIPWKSLKLRLALTTALLMLAGVALTVMQAVREVRHRAEQSIIESNLGLAQVATTLSANLVEHERALAAAARDWPPGADPRSAPAEAFVARQSVLRSLFDRVLLLEADPRRPLDGGLFVVSPPTRDLGAVGSLDIAVSAALAGSDPGRWRLAGTLSLRSDNFLSDATRTEMLGDTQLQTIVADADGRVLAHPDAKRVLSRVEDDPRLRETVARWRSEGAPLEPAPWTAQVAGNFVAMAAVPGTNWIVFRVAPAEALLGRASRSILHTTLIGIAVGLLGALAIFAVTAWLLQPMSRLQRRALKVLDPAQSAHEGWLDAGGEVGQLSQALRHVSEQLAASRSEMECSLRQTQAVLEYAPTGIAFTANGRLELVSQELERMLGYERGHLEGQVCTRLLPHALAGVPERAYAAFDEGRIFELEMQLRRRDESLLWAQVRGVEVRRHDAQRHAIWIVSDVTDARLQHERLLWNATRDPLTELMNRREFELQLRQLVMDRRRQSPACAVFIDLDHFKQVNDTAGHRSGDALLQRIAQALQRCVRSEDAVARLGGDEFALLLRGCGLEQAGTIAEQIRAEVQARGEVPGVARAVTASIGLVEIDGSHATLADVLEAADQACYAAKHAGRNVVRCASPQLIVPSSANAEEIQ